MKYLPLLFFAVLWMPACATGPGRLPVSTGEWITLIAQFQFTGSDRSLVGDAIIRYTEGGDFEINVSKGPATMLNLRVAGSQAGIDGAMARGGWHGPVTRAPDSLAPWVALREAFVKTFAARSAGPVTRTESVPPGRWRAELYRSGGKSRTLTVMFPQRGERFIFNFADQSA